MQISWARGWRELVDDSDGGHRIATLDPLGLGDADLDDTVPPELNVSSYFSPDELSLPVHLSADGAQQAGMIVSPC